MADKVTSSDGIVSWKEWQAAQERQKAAEGTSLNMNDFYKLLAAQLQNQDMNNPMDNSEMMNQMTQMAMMRAIDDMTTINTTTYAASMIGKEATFAAVDVNGVANGSVSGIITGVDLTNYVFYLDGNTEKAYPMAYLMSIQKEGSSNVKPPEPGGDGEEGKDPEKPGTDPEKPEPKPELG